MIHCPLCGKAEREWYALASHIDHAHTDPTGNRPLQATCYCGLAFDWDNRESVFNSLARHLEHDHGRQEIETLAALSKLG